MKLGFDASRPPTRRRMLRQRRQPHFAHFARAAVERAGVIHDPVIAVGFEMRSADEHHQVIGLALSGLMKVEQIAGACRARVAAERLRVETDQRLGVGELRVLRSRARRSRETAASLSAPARGARAHVGELRREGQARSAHPLRRVRAQRFAHGVPHQRGAILHVRRSGVRTGRRRAARTTRGRPRGRTHRPAGPAPRGRRGRSTQATTTATTAAV